jgi:CHASE1-domain containing sensor protein
MKKARHFRLRIIVAVILVSLLCIFPASTYYRAQHRIARQTTTKFDERTDNYTHELEHTLEAYGDNLYSLRGLFAATTVDTTAWDRYIDQLPQKTDRYRGVQSLAYAQVVPQDQVAAFEADQRSRHGKDRPIHPLKDQGDYAAIALHSSLADISTTERSLGLDIASDEVRRQALTTAWQTNGIVATGPIKLATLGTTGFLLISPVANSNGVPAAGKPYGYVFAVFDVKNMVDAHLGDTLKKYKTSMKIEDVTGKPELFYSINHPTSQRTINREVIVNVGNRKWRLTYSAPSSSMTMITDRMAPNVMMTLSILLIVLAGIVVYSYRLRRNLKDR